MNSLPKNRLTILLLTPQLPYPPEQGTSLRNYHILRGLARDHEVHLLSFRENEQEALDIPTPLEELCASVTTVPVPQRLFSQRLGHFLFNPRPDMAHRLKCEALNQALIRTLERTPFDVVQVEGIELAPVIDLLRRQQPHCKIVFDNHNAEAELQRRMFITDLRRPGRWLAAFYSLIQWRRLRHFERRSCLAADAVSVVSNADRLHLMKISPRLDPFVIPNCIDVEEYRRLSSTVQEVNQYDLLFIGKMDYRPNVDAVLWFSREIWPMIRESRPTVSWAVVGKHPHRRLHHLADEPGIHVTGSVPDIKPFLAGARVYVMPFRIGSGTRLKLIEALAAGVATVSTHVGAEGYPLVSGKQILLEDAPAAFARAVLQLLEDEAQRKNLQQEGRAFAMAYDWRRVIPRFNQLYGRLGLN